jgi:unsaturated chondroitin disaccharide hydrolase
MRTSVPVLILLLMLLAGCERDRDVFPVKDARNAMNFAVRQYSGMMAHLPDTLEPRSFKDGQMVYSDIKWWCSGFYPGVLWYLYEYTGRESLRNEAHKRTMRLEPIKNVTNDHDLGFMLYCSFGNGLRLTGRKEYEEILLTGSKSLATRFNPVVGSIKSWDWNPSWKFPVIIDNMMNLELLMWASKTAGDPSFREISLEHSFSSLKNFYRDDFSCFHVVDFDPETGAIDKKFTHQGYSDESTWARGQSWGLYGFTMMYRESGIQDFLDQAVSIADYLLNHPNMPEDLIPYWDYNCPQIPDSYRDASAAAIMASALIELSVLVEDDKGDDYLFAAQKILKTLSSSKYLAGLGENGNFILKHSVGNLPSNSEVDVPLTYADYYYVEALMRYLKLKG